MLPPASTDFQDAWRHIVARAWSDPHFREELLRQPELVLARAGIECPDGARFVVVENSSTQLHLVLPAAPTEEAVIEEASSSAVGHYHAACW